MIYIIILICLQFRFHCAVTDVLHLLLCIIGGLFFPLCVAKEELRDTEKRLRWSTDLMAEPTTPFSESNKAKTGDSFDYHVREAVPW